jgi:hypothetical protein
MRESLFRERGGIEIAGCERGAEAADGPRRSFHKAIVRERKAARDHFAGIKKRNNQSATILLRWP